MIKVLINTSPLTNGNAHRGVGQYTQLLTEQLEKNPELSIQRSGQASDAHFPADIVHYPFFDLFYPTLPLWRKAKTVVTIHDVIPLLYPKYYPAGKRGTVIFWRQKAALKTVSAVITDSQASAADIEKFLGISAHKITVAPLAANPLLAPAKPAQIAAARKRWNLPAKYLLYVGDINYNKNIPQLIKTLKFLPADISLVCVGKNFYPQEIPEWRWIEAQIALSDVGDRIKFITDLASDEVETLAALYTGATIYVQPSLYEGFGLPVLEAMTCHTPVVATKTSSLLEVVGEAGLLVEPTAEALTAGITQVLEYSAAKRQKVITTAAAWAKTFDWQKTAAITAKVYQSIIERS
jgi:glycosyltransferase involved in cell wall biosynthesis